jgi:hypothetical protein
MIICQLVEKVLVSEGYAIEVKLTVTMEQYMEFAECDTMRSA